MVSGKVYRFSVTNPRVVFQSYYFEVYWIRRAIFFSEVAWKCECQYFVYLRQFRYCIPQKESFSIWDTFWRSPCCNFSAGGYFPDFGWSYLTSIQTRSTVFSLILYGSMIIVTNIRILFGKWLVVQMATYLAASICTRSRRPMGKHGWKVLCRFTS